uniref:CD248 molecule, endosialin a n=1 Tax=Mastacembelus armatus TaxID=205130 RepID=A0A3Q3KK32_9TELE
MGSLISSATALLLTFLLALLCGISSVLGQELSERDALCNADGCFVVYFQRKTFLDSWRACKKKDGNLATIKRKEDATTIAALFSTLDLHHLHTKVHVWIGLQRQPRQCTSTHLRGFSWTTGDQDTEYTNWQNEDSPAKCSAPRCVVMSYSIHEQNDNLKWLDGPCSVPVDGYLCHYSYKGMCPTLWNEGAGNAQYTTPFTTSSLSTLLTHIPFGSVAVVSCPTGQKEEQRVVCMLKVDGSVGWSRDPPLCSDPPVSHNLCDKDNGGCEHFCRLAGDHVYCECASGYKLGDDGKNCELFDACQGAPCDFQCLPHSDGYRCACPDGYMLAPDERGCLDVDECLQSPCEQLCVNAPGTFECRCREGYHLDDEGGCEDLDECIHDPCEHACENTPGSHICHCHLGFFPMPEDPSRCQDTDECQIPGACQQMCVNYEGGFQCYCVEGYELMSDHYSCQKRGDDQSTVTPPFPWVTHQPGSKFDPVDYDWKPQQSHTDWPPGEEHWLTDLPRVLNSNVIWVTSAPHVELPTDLALDLQTQGTGMGTENDKKNIHNRGEDGLNWVPKFQSETEFLHTIYTIPPPTTSSSTVQDLYEDDKETTTALPFLSTSTISEGAWNWWKDLTTSSQNRDDIVRDKNMPTDSSYHNEGEELSKDSQSPPGKGRESGDIVDSILEERGQKQSTTWLLVGLLVPIGIIIVVMVVLCIVYCTRCAVQPRNKNATDCYHWISGAHDKQGTAHSSAGVKTHV